MSHHPGRRLAALALSLSLAACQTTAGPGGTPGAPGSINLEQARQIAVGVCSFLPDLVSLAAIVAAAAPGYATADALARGVCAIATRNRTSGAVGLASVQPRTYGSLNGVAITGRFVT